MKRLSLLALGASLLLCQRCVARPATDSDPGVQGAVDPYLYQCTVPQEKLVKEAWDEARLLAEAHAKWSNPGIFLTEKYQKAMDLYMGTDSSGDSNFWSGAGPLKKQVTRQLDLHTGSTGNPPRWTYAMFYCDEEKLPWRTIDGRPRRKRCEENPRITAWTFDEIGFLYNMHYVVFCPKTFFNTTKVVSLAKRTEEANGNPELQRVINPWRATRARILFHETYHWEHTVSQPKCIPKKGEEEIYTPEEVVQLAKEKNIAESRINAESWTLAAVAMYIQDKWGLSDPPVPANAPNALGGLTEDIEERSVSMPDDFEKPQPNIAGGSINWDLPGYKRLSSV